MNLEKAEVEIEDLRNHGGGLIIDDFDRTFSRFAALRDFLRTRFPEYYEAITAESLKIFSGFSEIIGLNTEIKWYNEEKNKRNSLEAREKLSLAEGDSRLRKFKTVSRLAPELTVCMDHWKKIVDEKKSQTSLENHPDKMRTKRDALGITKIRLAKGEINKNEYNDLKRT